MSEIVIVEELIRQVDPATLQRLLVQQIEEGVTVFYVKPAGMTWVEFGGREITA